MGDDEAVAVGRVHEGGRAGAFVGVEHVVEGVRGRCRSRTIHSRTVSTVTAPTATGRRVRAGRRRIEVGDQGREPRHALVDPRRLQRAARQPDRVGAAAVAVEEAHRRPQHAVLARRDLQQLPRRRAPARRRTTKKPPLGRVPGDAVRSGRREVPLQRGQQRAQVVAGRTRSSSRLAARRLNPDSTSTPPITACAIGEVLTVTMLLTVDSSSASRVRLPGRVDHGLVGDEEADPGAGEAGLRERAEVDHPLVGVERLERRAGPRRRGRTARTGRLPGSAGLPRRPRRAARRRVATGSETPDGLAKFGTR